MKKEDVLEKGHELGDVHPKYSNYTWQERNGKKGWFVTKKGSVNTQPSNQPSASDDGSDNNQGGTAGNNGKSQTVSTGNGSATVTRTKMSSDQLKNWAKKTPDATLLKVLNNTTNKNVEMRQIAYDELVERGVDKSKFDTSGTLQDVWDKKNNIAKMTGAVNSDDDNGKQVGASVATANNTQTSSVAVTEEDLNDKWWLDKNDFRTQKKFNGLKTLRDRQKYDEFLDKKKRADPDYVEPLQQRQDLNAEYLNFLDSDASPFLVSCGGAGVGKTWGFKKLAELLNLRKFDPEVDKPGDADYDWVIATNAKSEKQFQQILKDHNGKIILFDDNDAVLTRNDIKAALKTATDNDPDARVFKDPETNQNIKFTGKIACITNKSLDSLTTDEDGKAVMSRAKKLEINFTVNENLEILKSMYKDMEINGLDLDPKEEAKAREEVFHFIIDNKDKLDPAKFTVRKFRDVMLDVQGEKKRNKYASQSAAMAKLVGTGRGWQKTALATLNKAQDEDLSDDNSVGDSDKRYNKVGKGLAKKIKELRKKNPKLADTLFGKVFDKKTDEEEEEETDETEKAFNDEMSIEEAEDILLN